ncbi:(Fe-S)-binding protein [Nocardia sp. NPDC052001]|uniref:(Fe-S)-binding protein n=1 Tax=Nocardia sp. NPDC052001 TaxID=3154853 RepID=UPI00343C9FD6
MSTATITLGIIGALITLHCWGVLGVGLARMVRVLRAGQADRSRWRPVVPRLKTVFIEVAAHTRMNKFRTVGWAHWLVMVGFLLGMVFYFESYGQTFDPEFDWPIVGHTFGYHLLEEILSIGTLLGIGALITIRQLNHPRRADRLSRFGGSNFRAAYIIETIVVTHGFGDVLVKAGRIATYGGGHIATDPLTMQVAKLLPASPVLISSFAFVKMLAGAAFLYLVGRYLTWGVAWHRLSAFVNIYFKREPDGGVALGAAKPMMSGGKVLDMETADPDVDAFGAGKVEDFSWKALLDFTTCTECGRCQSQCPAWNTGKPLSPKLLITSLRDHTYAKAPYLLGGDPAKLSESERAEAERPLVGEYQGGDSGGVIDPEVLWSCTTCGACVEQCPVDIEHVDHIIDMRRYQVLIESEFPSELAGLFKNLENKGNPWGQNAKDRLNWISEIDFEVPVFGKDADSFDGYEYLFWVGCAGAYEDRAKKTTKAVAELLATAGVKFMVLGQEETCTGDSARRAGNEFLFQQLAMQNIAVLDSVFEGVEASKKKIVVTCAHCFNALNNEYPQVGGTYEVVHHTQLLNRLVRSKNLIPVSPVAQNLTYHDPCYLGRHNKIYNAPRELLAASGSALIEMPRHGERSMCCGAGGARMWMEEQLGKRINIDRADEALATLSATPTPGKIATGCPFCRVMLSDGVTARQDGLDTTQKVEVVDVAQLMLDAITRIDPATLSQNLRVDRASEIPRTDPTMVTADSPAQIQSPTVDLNAVDRPAAGPLAPPAKGLAMKGLAKKPGAKAPGAATIPTAKSAPVAGLAMKGSIKAPGKRG